MVAWERGATGRFVDGTDSMALAATLDAALDAAGSRWVDAALASLVSDASLRMSSFGAWVLKASALRRRSDAT